MLLVCFLSRDLEIRALSIPIAGYEAYVKINCPKCMEYRASRVKRTSLLQKTIMTLLGYFPWQCGACHAIFYSKNRGLHRVA